LVFTSSLILSSLIFFLFLEIFGRWQNIIIVAAIIKLIRNIIIKKLELVVVVVAVVVRKSRVERNNKQYKSYLIDGPADGASNGASNGASDDAVVAAAVVVSVDVAWICSSLFFSRCRSRFLSCAGVLVGTGHNLVLSPNLFLRVLLRVEFIDWQRMGIFWIRIQNRLTIYLRPR